MAIFKKGDSTGAWLDALLNGCRVKSVPLREAGVQVWGVYSSDSELDEQNALASDDFETVVVEDSTPPEPVVKVTYKDAVLHTGTETPPLGDNPSEKQLAHAMGFVVAKAKGGKSSAKGVLEGKADKGKGRGRAGKG